MTVLASAVVATARSMLTGWEYILGAHGRFDPATGRYETDCQYLVDRVMTAVGLAYQLGPELPWEVAYMVDHTTFAKVAPDQPAKPGWIVVMGVPGATDFHIHYQHTGIMTGPTTYVSALNPTQGVMEIPTSKTAGLSVMMYLDTGVVQDVLPQPQPVLPPAPPPTPAPAPVRTYTVVRGDNLSKIARAYGTTWPQLVAWNKATYPSLSANPGLIYPGWMLRVS